MTKLGKPHEVARLLFTQVFIGMILVVVLPTTLLGVVASGHITIVNVVGALLLMSILQFMPNALNNHVDWEIDEMNEKRLEMHAAMEKHHLLIITLALFVISLVFFIFGNIYLKATMLIGYFLILNYNMLLRAKDKIFLNYSFIALFYGSIAFAIGFFFSSSDIALFTSIIWIPIFLFFIDLGFSVSKDYEDEEGDRKHNKRTVPVVFGKNVSQIYQAAVITLVFAWIFYVSSTQLNRYMLALMALFYIIAIYSLNMVRTTHYKSRYHTAHNLIRINALMIRVSLMLPFVVFGYHALVGA